MSRVRKIQPSRYQAATAEPPVTINPPEKEPESAPENVEVWNGVPASGGPLNVSRHQGTVLTLYFIILGIRVLESQRLGNAFGALFSPFKKGGA